MSAPRYLARLGAGIALATTLASASIVAGVAGPSSALTLTNSKPSGLYNCDPMSTSITSACLSGALSDINAARRKEGVKAMVLPSNFAALSMPNQLLTLTNVERRDRGISTFLYLSPTLNSYAMYAANRAMDPLFPSWTRSGGSNWASPKNSLWDFFLWMYDDGVGSANLDCTAGNTSGCWGHRNNILANYGAPRIMGAALGSTGLATIMLGLDYHDLLTPNAPGTVWGKQITYRRLATSWPTPTYRGAPILRYYARVDGGVWQNTGLRQSWTTWSLSRGYHWIAVRSYNKYGYSVRKSVQFYVR